MDNLAPKPDKPPVDPKQQQKLVGLLMMEAGIEFAFLIAVPLLVAVFAGKWLANKYHHSYYSIILILAALAISALSIYKRILDYKAILDRKTKQ